MASPFNGGVTMSATIVRDVSRECLSLKLFGGFRLQEPHSGRDVPVPIRKGQALLAYLARRPDEAHPRDKLATLLWGDMSQALARHSLRQTLCVLRAALPAGAASAIRAGSDDISIDATRLAIDVVEFERLADEGTSDSLEQASLLYRGEFLDGIAVDEPVFEDWLREERAQLHEAALSALARLLRLQRDAGLVESAIQTGLRMLRIDPLQEVVHRSLMRLYASAGRPGAALHQYQLCVRMLRREFGAAPEQETERVLRAILPPRVRRP
jgi:DNA-binding SARP family transcriptional activator